MKYLKVIVKLLSIHKWANFLIILEICLVMFALTVMINRYTDAFRYVSTFEEMQIDHSIYFMGSTPVWNDDTVGEENPIEYGAGSSNEIKQYLEEQPEYLGTSTIVRGGVQINPNVGVGEFIGFYAYDKVTAGHLDSLWQMKELFAASLGDGELPCIVYQREQTSNKFSVGQTFTGNIWYTIDLEGNYVERSQVFRVIAVVDDKKLPAFFPDAGGTELRLDNLFAMKEDSVLFVPYQESVFGAIESNFYMVYLDETIMDERWEEIQSELSLRGYSSTISSIKQNTRQIAAGKLQSDASGFVSLSGLAALTLICVAFLNAKKLQMRFAIYNLIGCTYSRSFRLYIIYLSTLVLIATAICIILNTVFGIYYHLAGPIDFRLDILYAMLDLSDGSGWLAALLCLGIVVFSAAIHILFMRRMKSLVNIYKGN